MSPCEPIYQKLCRASLATTAVAFCCALQPSISCGQQFGVPMQLPTTSVFSVDTTVSVPDGGAISLGGNSGSAWSSTRSGGRFRPFGNRAIGGSQFASSASVHVQIISLAEMEAELLSQLPGDRSLDDYARPQSPGLIIRETTNSAVTPDPSETQLHDRTIAPTEARASNTLNSGRSPSRRSTSSQSTPASPSRFKTEVVDPNGSKQVQDKADFMSRHIGRKKK